MSYYVNPHQYQCPWYPYAELFGAPNIQWCEQTMCHWISEPANTYSNFAFIIVAIVLGFATRHKPNKQTDVFLKLMFGLGLASGFYHMSGNFLGQILDFTFMFLFMFWGVSFNLKKMDKIQSHKQQWKYTFAGTLFFLIVLFIMYFTHLQFQLLVPVVAVILIYSEIKARPINNVSFKYLYSSLAVILVAQIFSLLDRTGTLCDPNNHNFQGHAVWHVLSAIGLGLAFLHWHGQVEPDAPIVQEEQIDEESSTIQESSPESFHEMSREDFSSDNDLSDQDIIDKEVHTEEEIKIVSTSETSEPKKVEIQTELNTGDKDIDPLTGNSIVDEVDESQLGFDELMKKDDK